MGRFEVGDVVFFEGSSAINGDVYAVDEEYGVSIRWRITETMEQDDDEDLQLAARCERGELEQAERYVAVRAELDRLDDWYKAHHGCSGAVFLEQMGRLVGPAKGGA